eukprot:SAG22_NODE_11101_length_501_cov_1.017413_1_plen_124_part_10
MVTVYWQCVHRHLEKRGKLNTGLIRHYRGIIANSSPYCIREYSSSSATAKCLDLAKFRTCLARTRNPAASLSCIQPYDHEPRPRAGTAGAAGVLIAAIWARGSHARPPTRARRRRPCRSVVRDP